MKKSKFASLLIILLFNVLFLSATVSAAPGNKYKTGAVIPSYENTVTINVDSQSFDRTFVRALAEAEKANSNTQYKIIIPPGNYVIGHQYRVPGNTHIVATGAVFNATETRTAMLIGFPDRRSENIIIEGGTWSTLQQTPGTIIGAPFRFIGVKNLAMKNMIIETNRKGHIIEVADIYGLTIEGCTISGNNLDNKEPYQNVQPKEAIQLDVATPNAVPGYNTPDYMYNGKGCHRVLIKNNKFYNCARGIGSHSYAQGAEKKPYTHITVTRNTFTNLLAEAVHGEKWRDSTISKNKVTKCRQAALYFCEASNLRVSRNIVNDVKKYSGRRRQTYDPQGKYGAGILLRKTYKSYVDNNQVRKTRGIMQEFCKKNKLKNNQIKQNRK